MIKYIELCAGVGGFRLGIGNSNIQTKCVFKNEINSNCESTYFANFNEKFDVKDIFDVIPQEIPEFDMLCAGFPCQPFSLAGNQNGFIDERGKIYYKLSNIVKERQPKIVFLENVENLVKHDKGNTFKYILDDLHSLNYTAYSEVIDSSKFGLPQRRPRVYIVAFNNTVYPNIDFSFPSGNGYRITIRNILEENDYSIPISSKWNTYIDLYTNKIKEEDICFEVPKTRKKLERIASNCDLSDCIFQIRSSGIRAFSLDDVFPTFAVSNSGGGAMIPVLSKERRHLSLLEMIRLMGFPDSFVFPVSRTEAIKQLANAVCPPVITDIMNSIIKSTSR